METENPFLPTREDRSGFPVRREAPVYAEKKPLVHRDSRRAFFHDYCAPNRYLITATTNPGSPILSEMPDLKPSQLRKGDLIIPIHTPIGEAIRKEILDIPKYHHEIKILRFVIMPDHIHIILHVCERIKRKLGYELAGFFGSCSRHCREITGNKEFKTLFQPFNDSIIFNRNQLEKACHYVEDNPRRLIIKRQNPDLFRRYLHISINDHEYAAYGNIFLLKNPDLLPVRIHRRWNSEQFAEYKRRCLSSIGNGAVPISPAIHNAEKEILKTAIDMGGCVIRITDQGFEERFKPKGHDFDLCAEGRLLLLVPWPENTGRKSTAGYTEFHTMNDMAAAIASLSATTRMSIK